MSTSIYVFIFFMFFSSYAIPFDIVKHFRFRSSLSTGITSRLSAHEMLSSKFQLANMIKSGVLPTCGGLVLKACNACPGAAAAVMSKFCKDMKEQCALLFCSPMCLRMTWNCQVEFPSSLSSLDDSYSRALCAEFKAAACSKELGCCPEDRTLRQWLEQYVYADGFPIPKLPATICSHDRRDSRTGNRLCTQCKRIRVNLEIQDCTFPDPNKSAEKESKKLSLGLLEMYEYEKQKFQKYRSFLETRSSLSTFPPGFPGDPSFHTLQSRCLALRSKVRTRVVSMMRSSFQAQACQCLGCCDSGPECPFPVIDKNL